MTGWERLDKRKAKALRALSTKQAIALGEALLTSDIMRVARPRKGPRPPSLAAALGLRHRR